VIIRNRADELPAAAAREMQRVWTPTPYQKKILQRVEFEVLAGGAAGPGKTDALIAGGLRDIKYPDYHAAFFRREYPRLQEVMDRCHRYFKPLGATWSGKEKRWTFPSGAHFSFHHCQREEDRFNYLGDEFHYLAFDQLEEFTLQIYTFLIGRMRTAQKGRRLRLRSSANPGGEMHVDLVDRFRVLQHPEGFKPFRDTETGLSRVFIPGRVWDNPHILENDPAYIQRLLSISDPARRRAYLFGDWTSFSGQFFSTWDQQSHTCEPFEIPDWWEIELCLDYGYDPAPTTILFIAYNQHGQAFVYREITLEKATARQIAHALNAVAQTPRERVATMACDTQIWTKNPEANEVSVAQMITAELDTLGCGITLAQASKDRINGWARVHEFLDPRRPNPETQEQEPWLRVFRHHTGSRYGCPNLIKTLPAQTHNDKKPGDMKKNPTDHWVETLRYGLTRREQLPLIPDHLLPRQLHHQVIYSRTRQVLQKVLEQRQAEADAAGLEGDDALEVIGTGDYGSPETLADIWS
jgi:hypothetical protein